MSVNVRIPMTLRTFTGGRNVVSVEGASLQDAGLRRFMHVYLNGQDVRFLDGLDTDVAVGDSVTILPAAADGFLA